MKKVEELRQDDLDMDDMIMKELADGADDPRRFADVLPPMYFDGRKVRRPLPLPREELNSVFALVKHAVRQAYNGGDRGLYRPNWTRLIDGFNVSGGHIDSISNVSTQEGYELVSGVRFGAFSELPNLRRFLPVLKEADAKNQDLSRMSQFLFAPGFLVKLAEFMANRRKYSIDAGGYSVADTKRSFDCSLTPGIDILPVKGASVDVLARGSNVSASVISLVQDLIAFLGKNADEFGYYTNWEEPKTVVRKRGNVSLKVACGEDKEGVAGRIIARFNERLAAAIIRIAIENVQKPVNKSLRQALSK